MANSLIKFRLLIIFCLLLGVCLPGCGDLTNIGSLLVSPATVTVGINQSQAFTALGRNSEGLLVNTSPVAWSVVGNIGKIKPVTGLFTAGSVEGTGFVTATSNGLAGSAEVTITLLGWLTGNVTDTNGGLVIGIRVYLKENPALGSETNSNGNYTISGIPAGTYEADIDARNLTEAGSYEVTIFQGQTTTQNFILSTPSTTVTTTTNLGD